MIDLFQFILLPILIIGAISAIYSFWFDSKKYSYERIARRQEINRCIAKNFARHEFDFETTRPEAYGWMKETKSIPVPKNQAGLINRIGALPSETYNNRTATSTAIRAECVLPIKYYYGYFSDKNNC